MALRFKCGLIALGLICLGWTAPVCLGQTPQQAPSPGQPSSGSINGTIVGTMVGTIVGTIVDPSGAVVARARIRLTCDAQALEQDVVSDDDGQFSLPNVAPGPFLLTVTSAGFATQTFSGILHAGE